MKLGMRALKRAEAMASRIGEGGGKQVGGEEVKSV